MKRPSSDPNARRRDRIALVSVALQTGVQAGCLQFFRLLQSLQLHFLLTGDRFVVHSRQSVKGSKTSTNQKPIDLLPRLLHGVVRLCGLSEVEALRSIDFTQAVPLLT